MIFVVVVVAVVVVVGDVVVVVVVVVVAVVVGGVAGVIVVVVVVVGVVEGFIVSRFSCREKSRLSTPRAYWNIFYIEIKMTNFKNLTFKKVDSCFTISNATEQINVHSFGRVMVWRIRGLVTSKTFPPVRDLLLQTH